MCEDETDGAVRELHRERGNLFTHPLGTFWYPDGWSVHLGDSFVQLAPPAGDQPAGGEFYGLQAQPVGHLGITDPGDPRVLQFLDQAVASLRWGARREGDGEQVTVGASAGLELTWTWPGQDLVGKAFVAVVGELAGLILGIAPKARLEERLDDLRRIFSSISTDGGARDERLVGTWLNEKHFYAGRFASTRSRTRELRADGRFVATSTYVADMEHHEDGAMDAGGYADGDPGATGRTMADSGTSTEEGRWAASGGRLVMIWDDGAYAEWTTEVGADGNSFALNDADGNELWTRM